MRQWDEVEDLVGPLRAKFAADHLIQFRALNELRDCQTADWNNQMRFQNLDLFVHPRGTILNLVGRRHAISSAGSFPRETSTYSGEINSRSHSGLVHSAELCEPTEKCLASGMRERPFQSRLARTRRLTDQHHLTNNRAAGDGCRFHSWTTPAPK